MPHLELSCSECDWREQYGLEQMRRRVQEGGMLRRAEDPEPELIAELFQSAAAQWKCPQCQHKPLAATPLEDDSDESGWDLRRKCAVCGQPIDAERLELLPKAERCASCQQKADAGDGEDQREFCPHCGGLMQLRQSGGSGIARYVSRCTDCGR